MYAFSMFIGFLAIFICSAAFIFNLASGNFIWAIVMAIIVIINVVQLIRLYNAGRYL